jgi:hypothetical protein
MKIKTCTDQCPRDTSWGQLREEIEASEGGKAHTFSVAQNLTIPSGEKYITIDGGKNITLIGMGGNIELNGNNIDRFFLVNQSASLTLVGPLTLRGGNVQNSKVAWGPTKLYNNGGAIAVINGMLKANAVNFVGNIAPQIIIPTNDNADNYVGGFGGAVFVQSSYPEFDYCGGDNCVAHAAFSHCVFSNGIAMNGGAIAALGTGASLSVKDSTFENNVVGFPLGGYGGAIALYYAAAADIRGSIFSNNIGTNGGTICLLGSQGSNGELADVSTADIIDCRFSHNGNVNLQAHQDLATMGGALWLTAANSTVSGTSFDGNEAQSTKLGNAIYMLGARGTAVVFKDCVGAGSTSSRTLLRDKDTFSINNCATTAADGTRSSCCGLLLDPPKPKAPTGIIAAVSLLCAAFGLLFFYYYRRNKRARHHEDLDIGIDMSALSNLSTSLLDDNERGGMDDEGGDPDSAGGSNASKSSRGGKAGARKPNRTGKGATSLMDRLWQQRSNKSAWQIPYSKLKVGLSVEHIR